jgi:hypothetical protein
MIGILDLSVTSTKRQKRSIELISEQYGGSHMIMTLCSNKLKAAKAEALL